MWALIIFAANFRLYGMTEYSDHVVIVIFIGCLSFVIGYVLANTKLGRCRLSVSKRRGLREEKRINYKIVGLLGAISLTFYLIIFVRVIKILLSGTTYAVLRNMYGGEESYMNAIESWINGWIIVPFIFASIPLLVLLILEPKKKFSLISLLTIVIILYVFCTGSRIIVLIFAINLVLAMRARKMVMDKARAKKLWKKIRAYIIVLIAVIIVMTIYRYGVTGVTSETVFESYYSYFTASVPLLDYWAQRLHASKFYGYGMATLGGFVTILFMILHRFGLQYPIMLKETNNVIAETQTFLFIFKNRRYNAFVSMFYYFYADFRYFGVVLGSAVLGFVTARIEREMIKTNSTFSIAKYLLFSFCIVKSFIRFEFTNISYLMAFLILYICFINKSNSRNEEQIL